MGLQSVCGIAANNRTKVDRCQKVTINGSGRIGRATFKIIEDTPGLQLAAINDLMPPDDLAYLLKYDTAYSRYQKTAETENHTC